MSYTTQPGIRGFRHPIYGDAEPTGSVNTRTQWAEFVVKNPAPSESGTISLWFPLRIWNK